MAKFDPDKAMADALKVVTNNIEQRAKIALRRAYAYTPTEQAEVAAGLRKSELEIALDKFSAAMQPVIAYWDMIKDAAIQIGIMWDNLAEALQRTPEKPYYVRGNISHDR